jgi:hypothetical protein
VLQREIIEAILTKKLAGSMYEKDIEKGPLGPFLI